MLLCLSMRLSFSVGADLSIETCRPILHQPYSVHIAPNSSRIISEITGKTTTVIYAVLMLLVNLVGSQLFLLYLIMATLAAVALGKKFKSIGYDLSETKVNTYRQFTDLTGEVSPEDLCAAAASHFECTADQRRLASADFLTAVVSAPADEEHIPDFSPLVMVNTTAGTHS